MSYFWKGWLCGVIGTLSGVIVGIYIAHCLGLI